MPLYLVSLRPFTSFNLEIRSTAATAADILIFPTISSYICHSCFPFYPSSRSSSFQKPNNLHALYNFFDSAKGATFPIEVTISIYNCSTAQQIRLISHEYKIPFKIDVLINEVHRFDYVCIVRVSLECTLISSPLYFNV